MAKLDFMAGDEGMSYRNELCSFGRYDFHKGFYRDENPERQLENTYYADFFEQPDDIEFPYGTADLLLRGSCHLFALSLKKVFGYTPYIIKGVTGGGFHSFCQIYRNKKWYYVDARGITSSFSEFMDVAKTFVSDEYIIRQVTTTDSKEWTEDENYVEEGLAFAEAVIERYRECYSFP